MIPLRRLLDRARAERWLAPLVVGLVVRTAWSVWAFRTQFNYLHPAVQNLRMTRDFVERIGPRLGGEPTAFLPPGQPLLLAPLAWVVGKLDLELDLAVCVAQVLIGTGTILLAAALAARLYGRSSGRAAAWLFALAPGLVAVTPVATAHTVLLAVVLGALLLLRLDPIGGDPVGGRAPRWVLAGAAVGIATLVDPAAATALLPLTAVTWWPGKGRPPAARRWGWGALGLLVVLLPWAVRNGLQVGVWTPLPTRVAATSCMGVTDGDGVTLGDDPVDAYPRCHRSRLFREESQIGTSRTARLDDLPDESEWFGRTVWRSITDRVGDPGHAAARGVSNVYRSVQSGRGALDLVGDLGQTPLAHGRLAEVMGRVLDAWQGAVAVLAALAVALVRRCRRREVLAALAGSVVALAVAPAAGMPPLLLLAFATLVVAGLVGATADGSTPDEPDSVDAEPAASSPSPAHPALNT